ncbi:MAG: fructose-bisphosphatase class II, partial [Pseudomonadota bacterium]
KYEMEDMVRDDVIFAATGVTDGSIVRGARRIGDRLETETILMRSATGSVRRIHYSRTIG